MLPLAMPTVIHKGLTLNKLRRGIEMTGKYFLRAILLTLIIVIFAWPAFAADQPDLSQTVKVGSTDLKFSVGASLRLRQEIWTNVVSLGTNNSTQKDRDFFRIRASVWGKAEVGSNFDFYVRGTTEPKYYMGPYHPVFDGPNRIKRNQTWDQDEVVIDNVYISGKKLIDGLVDFRIGRQDFLAPEDIYGEGFLLMDGTPGDGSRTFYFNAAKARLNITKDNSIDFVYITDASVDSLLPSAHPAITGNALYYDNEKLLSTSHEQAYVAYMRNRFGKIATFDPYYIYKTEDGFSGNPRLNLHTAGARATFSSDGWRAKAEFAYQFGKYDHNSTYPHGIDRTGMGGYFFAGRKFDELPGKVEFDLGAVYLSGDNPNDPSSKRKAWDPLFSRNPYWNELYIYSLINETAGKYSGPIPGYWTNLVIYMIKGKANITDTTAITMTYQYLRSAETTTGLSSTEYSNRSRDRGHLPTAMLSHQFTKNIDGMLQFEYFIPGKFYTPNTKDALFFRWQLQFKI